MGKPLFGEDFPASTYSTAPSKRYRILPIAVHVSTRAAQSASGNHGFWQSWLPTRCLLFVAYYPSYKLRALPGTLVQPSQRPSNGLCNLAFKNFILIYNIRIDSYKAIIGISRTPAFKYNNTYPLYIPLLPADGAK